MAYTTPPTLNPTLKQDIDAMNSVFAKNVNLIARSLANGALKSSGIQTPKVSVPKLIQLLDNTIIPTIQYWEGAWSDHPSDSGGPTMRGVILQTFKQTFNQIFVNTGIPDVKAAAERFNAKYPSWRNDDTVGKQILYEVNLNAKVAGLWIVLFFCSKSCRYPLAIMTEDPFLGYFLAECCWATGPGVYGPSRCNFDQVARQYGWNGNTSQFALFCANLGPKTGEFASKLVEKRVQWIMKISAPGSRNAVFRKGWLNRLVNDPTRSNIATLIKINETFNLNNSKTYAFNSNEAQHLVTKGETYKTFSLSIPA